MVEKKEQKDLRDPRQSQQHATVEGSTDPTATATATHTHTHTHTHSRTLPCAVAAPGCHASGACAEVGARGRGTH